jgi:DNA polymerase-3 subunit gamma/tau
MVAYGGETITLDLVQSVLGMVASESVIQLVDALINRDTASGLELINSVVADGIDPRQFAREVVEHLRAVMLIKLGHRLEALNLPDELKTAIQTQAARVEPGFIVRATDRFNAALIDLKSSLLAIPQLPLELAFVEAVTAPAVASALPAVSPPAIIPAPLAVSSPPLAKIPASESSPVKVTPPRPVASPPPAKAPEVMPVAPDRTEGPLDLEMVRGSLEKVINLIAPRSKPMAEALRTAQLLAVHGDEILIVTFDLMKRRFEKPQPKAAINEAFSVILGQNVSVRFLSESEAKLAGSVRTSDQSGEGEPVEDEDVLALLKMATEELGGKIVE